MKTVKFLALAILSVVLAACSNEVGWKTDASSTFYTVEIPDHFEKMATLNPQAISAYGYVGMEHDTVKEYYMVVLMETKKDIEAYALDIDFDVNMYSDLCVRAIEGNEEFELFSHESDTAQVNGLSCVKNEIEGSVKGVNVFYKLAVYEGKNAFYQLLTWTLINQKNQFLPRMDHMIDSFKES